MHVDDPPPPSIFRPFLGLILIQCFNTTTINNCVIKKLYLTLYICGNHQTGIHVHVTTSPHVAASWLTHNADFFCADLYQ